MERSYVVGSEIKCECTHSRPVKNPGEALSRLNDMIDKTCGESRWLLVTSATRSMNVHPERGRANDEAVPNRISGAGSFCDFAGLGERHRAIAAEFIAMLGQHFPVGCELGVGGPHSDVCDHHFAESIIEIINEHCNESNGERDSCSSTPASAVWASSVPRLSLAELGTATELHALADDLESCIAMDIARLSVGNDANPTGRRTPSAEFKRMPRVVNASQGDAATPSPCQLDQAKPAPAQDGGPLESFTESTQEPRPSGIYIPTATGGGSLDGWSDVALPSEPPSDQCKDAKDSFYLPMGEFPDLAAVTAAAFQCDDYAVLENLHPFFAHGLAGVWNKARGRQLETTLRGRVSEHSLATATPPSVPKFEDENGILEESDDTPAEDKEEQNWEAVRKQILQGVSERDCAARLKICVTRLKHMCRARKILRWPSRRVSMYANARKALLCRIGELEEKLLKRAGDKKSRNDLAAARMNLKFVEEEESDFRKDLGVTMRGSTGSRRFEKVRQAIYKQNHRKNKGKGNCDSC